MLRCDFITATDLLVIIKKVFFKLTVIIISFIIHFENSKREEVSESKKTKIGFKVKKKSYFQKLKIIALKKHLPAG